jgi:hypothetical protein
MFEAITAWYPNLFGSGKLIASQQAVARIHNVIRTCFNRP